MQYRFLQAKGTHGWFNLGVAVPKDGQIALFKPGQRKAPRLKASSVDELSSRDVPYKNDGQLRWGPVLEAPPDMADRPWELLVAATAVR